MQEKFKKYLVSSARILITSHISPDPDAVSSALLLGRILQKNFPDKQINVVLEERPNEDLSFLAEYDTIVFQPLIESLAKLKPELFIIMDANNLARISRLDAEKVRKYLNSGLIKTVVIDHHEPDDKDVFDIVINNKRPATAEEVYVLSFEKLGLKKPADYAETALLGILSDTQRHRFDHPGYRETYRVVSELLDDGASIERLESRLEHYSKDELETFSRLASNIQDSGKGYTYSLVDDEFYEQWKNADKSDVDLKNAVEQFTNRFIKSYEGNKWGFVIYPDGVSGRGHWAVSLRSATGEKDVAEIARKLGGGGHKPAAGAKIVASSARDALEKVKAAI